MREEQMKRFYFRVLYRRQCFAKQQKTSPG